MSEIPSFDAFFSALHGHPPFPWQARLARVVLNDGWPDLLDLPTGAGKTSALDVALYALAIAPDRMPRRTLLVVDRRIVVDQGADHARAVQSRLHDASDGPLRSVADRLRDLWSADAEEPPFAIAVMRGGMPRDNDWARRPDQPVLGVSTIDQVGSRLLFRGYGLSSRSASIHAGLVGNDTLVLLDEVHLAVPFAQTLTAVRERFRAKAPGLPSRFVVTQMSATPGAVRPGAGTFAIDDADRADPVLERRLSASKRASLDLVKVTGGDEAKKTNALVERLVTHAIALQTSGAKVVAIVVNRVDTARAVHAHIAARHPSVTRAILVTGRMRPIERDVLVRRDLLPRAGAGRDRARDEPLVIVATQCIEAGADLDFDGLVTECASLDALKQRFGRVDRRGALGSSNSVIVARSDGVAADSDDPVYGTALAETWTWLVGIARDGGVDFGVDALPAPSAPDALLAPREDAPVMLPAHLDALAQTSPVPANDPDVALFLHGPSRDTADVQVVWRANASPSSGLVTRLLARRPSTLEAISVPIAAARRWLGHAEAPPVADVVASRIDEEERPRAEREEGVVVALRWRAEDSVPVTASEIRPGDVLVVDVTRGGLSAGSFDPNASAPVSDFGDLAQLRARGRATFSLNAQSLSSWGLEDAFLASMPTFDAEEATSDLRDRVRDWIGTFPDEAPTRFLGTQHEWSAAVRALRSRKLRVEVIDGEIVAIAPVVRRDLDPEVADALTEDDDSSFRSAELTLSVHSTDVRDLARSYARAIGFADEIVDDVALAGWFHDVGKADPRFQRWLVGGSDVRASMLEEPLAKSALPPGSIVEQRLAQRRAGYPAGYRHELLSLAMVQAATDALASAHDRDLVLHLVASHHGWCRPFAPALDHPEDLHVAVSHGGVTLKASTRHRAARLDSGVAERFWSLTERYGWWGLAWLEAVMRLADHRASEMREVAR